MATILNNNSGLDTAVVVLKPSFEQADFTGAVWTRAYCAEVRALPLISITDIRAERLAVQVAGGSNGSYLDADDAEVARLVALSDERVAAARARASEPTPMSDWSEHLTALMDDPRSAL